MTFRVPNIGQTAIEAQAQLDSVDIDALVAGTNRTGVVIGCAVTPQGTPNMTVAVATGLVAVAGAVATVTATNVTIGANATADPRFDIVVASAGGVVSVVAGAPDAAPAFAAIPASSVILAAVYVPAGATSIPTANIVDKRVIVTFDRGRSLDVRDFGAVCDGVAGYDGVMTAGSAFLDSPTANWPTTGLIGKTIVVDACGPSAHTLVTTIASRQSATRVTLATAAGFGSSSATFVYGTDNIAALSAADAVVADGDDVFFPKGICMTSGRPFNFDSMNNVTLKGVSGRVGVSRLRGARSALGAHPAGSTLLFIASGPGTLLSAVDSIGFTVANLGIRYFHDQFTGDVISLYSVNNSYPSLLSLFEKSVIGGFEGGRDQAVNARSCIRFVGHVWGTIRDCAIGFAQHGITGREAGNSMWSNVVNITNGVFDHCAVAPILNPGDAWTLTGVTFEESLGSVTGAVLGGSDPNEVGSNLVIQGCSFWDAVNSGGNPWISFYGDGLRVRDCLFHEMPPGSVAVFHGANANKPVTKGLSITGCSLYGDETAHLFATDAAGAYMVTEVEVGANIFGAYPNSSTGLFTGAMPDTTTADIIDNPNVTLATRYG